MCVIPSSSCGDPAGGHQDLQEPQEPQDPSEAARVFKRAPAAREGTFDDGHAPLAGAGEHDGENEGFNKPTAPSVVKRPKGMGAKRKREEKRVLSGAFVPSLPRSAQPARAAVALPLPLLVPPPRPPSHVPPHAPLFQPPFLPSLPPVPPGAILSWPPPVTYVHPAPRAAQHVRPRHLSWTNPDASRPPPQAALVKRRARASAAAASCAAECSLKLSHHAAAVAATATKLVERRMLASASSAQSAAPAPAVSVPAQPRALDGPVAVRFKGELPQDGRWRSNPLAAFLADLANGAYLFVRTGEFANGAPLYVMEEDQEPDLGEIVLHRVCGSDHHAWMVRTRSSCLLYGEKFQVRPDHHGDPTDGLCTWSIAAHLHPRLDNEHNYDAADGLQLFDALPTVRHTRADIRASHSAIS